MLRGAGVERHVVVERDEVNEASDHCRVVGCLVDVANGLKGCAWCRIPPRKSLEGIV